MARRSKPGDPHALLEQLKHLLDGFEIKLEEEDLRPKVLALVPVIHMLRDLGSSLLPADVATGARGRILHYFRRYPQKVIAGDELLVVAGIDNWARRLRELRKQFGWKIANGSTVREMISEGDLEPNLGGEDLVRYGRSRICPSRHRTGPRRALSMECGQLD